MASVIALLMYVFKKSSGLWEQEWVKYGRERRRRRRDGWVKSRTDGGTEKQRNQENHTIRKDKHGELPNDLQPKKLPFTHSLSSL